MPNWVFNSLVVSGDFQELNKMVSQLNTSYTRPYNKHDWDEETKSWKEFIEDETVENPAISFWNIVKPTDLDAYLGKEQISYSDKATENFGSNFVAEFNEKVAKENTWYYWNLRNWGCKWDASDVNFEWTDKAEAMYHFSTPWSPAVEAIEELSRQYPTLKFNLEFEEEQGWGAELSIVDGEQETIREWDIPCSHADYKAQDKECYCEVEDDPQYWYDDCPVDTTKYRLVDGEWEELSDPSAMIDLSN